MAHKTRNISVLQFDEHLIAWTRIGRTTRGVHVLNSAFERGAWAATDGSLETALKRFANDHHIADDLIYSVLPRHDMTARIIDLPSQDPAEIAGMVQLSATEYVPYLAEELAIGQCVLNKTVKGESRVLAVFSHRDIVESHLRLLEAAGLEPERLFLSTSCLASGAINARPGCDEHYALVNLASGGIEFLVFRGQRFEYGRGVAANVDWGGAVESMADLVSELAAEIRSTLSAYRRESEDGATPEVLYICSDWADVTGLAEALTPEAGIECMPARFCRELVVRGAEHCQALNLTALGAGITAQERTPFVINLLPESYVQRRASTRIKRRAIILAAVLLVNILALAGLDYLSVRQRMAAINALDARIAEVEPYARGVLSKQRQLQILQEQIEKKGSVLELLAAICDVAPNEGLSLTRIDFVRGAEINLWGRTKTLNEVDQFAQAIRELGKTTFPQLADARRLYETEIYEQNKPIFSYAIGIPFPIKEGDEEEGNEGESASPVASSSDTISAPETPEESFESSEPPAAATPVEPVTTPAEDSHAQSAE